MSTETTLAQFDHFIPVATRDLIERLRQDSDNGLDTDKLAVIHKLEQILSFQFYRKLVEIKRYYQPFNPDSDLLLPADRESNVETCIDNLRELLTAANYTELNEQQIQYALQKTSPYGLEVKLDFNDFEHVALFYRGKSKSRFEVRDWKRLYLKKKSLSLVRYQRIFLVLQFKPGHDKPGLHLKLFKDILRPDLEMLFPDCKLRMKMFDKIKLMITGGGGTAGGLFATIGKITAAVNPWTIFIAVAGFAALIWRQVSKVFVQKTRYMATLAQNLYFHNLDNNAGAITYLIDMARQEEIKETILAYALLTRHPGLSQAQLDSACEDWFQHQFDRAIDFDISDAVAKLRRFELLETDGDTLSCKPAQQVLPALDHIWHDYIDIEARDKQSNNAS